MLEKHRERAGAAEAEAMLHFIRLCPWAGGGSATGTERKPWPAHAMGRGSTPTMLPASPSLLGRLLIGPPAAGLGPGRPPVASVSTCHVLLLL